MNDSDLISRLDHLILEANDTLDARTRADHGGRIAYCPDCGAITDTGGPCPKCARESAQRNAPSENPS